MGEGCGVGDVSTSHTPLLTPATAVPSSRTRTQHLFFPPSAQTPTPQLKPPFKFQFITMNSNTRCQLTSSSMGGSLIGSRGTDPRYPFQPLMALHNPRNIDATGSRDYEANQRVQGKSMLSQE